jgi:hypothetical protein
MSSIGETTTANGPNSTTEQAKVKAQEGAQQAKRTVRDQVDQRSTQAGERVGSTAGDIRSVSEELRRQGKDQPARLAEQAAERAESLGDYLKRSDGDTILRDAERLGRDKPWAVMAGGLALGVLASRFLKASSSRRYHELESSPNLPARRADVDRGALSPAPGVGGTVGGVGATTPAAPGAPATPAAPAAPAAPGVTSPVPGAPERELSLSGGVMPERPATPGPGPGTAR